MQPGVRSRFVSLEGVGGERLPGQKREGTFNKMIVQDREDPDVKFKNRQNEYVKPSMILRKKGFNPF